MKLIVWLGNPWAEYAKTRHNIWFIMIDLYCEKNDICGWKFDKKYNAEIIKTDEGIFCKPQTYMNKSWEAIRKIIDFYKIPIENILVLHDDIDLPIGKIQKKIGWSAAWHNWLKSILQQLQNINTFTRVRIGVDRPQNKEDVVGYVLDRLWQKERESIIKQDEHIFSLIHDFLEW